VSGYSITDFGPEVSADTGLSFEPISNSATAPKCRMGIRLYFA